MGPLRDEPKRGSTAFAGERKEVSVGNQVVVLHGWPHEQKNQYILTGYKYHETPWETLEHFVSLTNETANIATALIEAALGVWLGWATLHHWDDLAADSRVYFLVAAVAYVLATVAIVAYHTCNTHAPLYHISSASDLLAINVSIVAMALCCTAAGIPNRLVGLVVAEDLMLLGTLATVGLAAGGVFAYRIQLTREAPKWTILANISPAVTVGLAYLEWAFGQDFLCWLIPEGASLQEQDLARSPLGDAHHGMWFVVAIFGGGALYGLKFPERCFPLTFDLIGNSHNIWHVGYVIGLFALTWDCFQAALLHGAGST
ncbi:Paqr5 [Symbiodinium sp. KB8]|nr:Paqr5 [Symbiodinium sp. KB8]